MAGLEINMIAGRWLWVQLSIFAISTGVMPSYAVTLSFCERQIPEDGRRDAAPEVVDPRWDTTRARGSTRTIDFVTDEGTWTDLDVARDGQWVVFDLLGHIYRVPMGGGTAVSLTQGSGVALNQYPAVSPDGAHIAFVSDRSGQDALWIMDINGSHPHQVFMDPVSRIAHPAWLPNGLSLVAERHFGSDQVGMLHRRSTIWIFPLDGMKPQELISEPGIEYRWPSPSPDGRSLYVQVSNHPAHSSMERSFKISKIDMGTRRVSPVLQVPAEAARIQRSIDGTNAATSRGANVMAPQIAPDGKHLAFARELSGESQTYRGHEYSPRVALFVRDLDSGLENKVMDPIDLDLSMAHTNYYTNVLPGYAWAPDSASLIVPQDGKIRRVWLATQEIGTIPFVAHVERTITEQARAHLRIDDETLRVRFLMWPASSRDGKLLAVTAAGRIWVLGLPEGAPRLLTENSHEGQEFTPAVSPDGREIVFATWDESKGGNIWKIASNGGIPQRLTKEAGEYIYPTWSADGASIAFSAVSPSEADLASTAVRHWDERMKARVMIMPSSGGIPRQLVLTPTIERAWFGTDNRVYYEFVPPRATDTGDDSSATVQSTAFNWQLRTYNSDSDSNRPSRMATIRSVAHDGSGMREHVQFSVSPDNKLTWPTQHPMISPNGRWLAYQWAHEVYLVRVPTETGAAPQIDINGNVPATHRIRLGKQGGIAQRWRNDRTLEFVSGDSYVTYDVITKALSTRRVAISVPRNIGRGTIGLLNAKVITLGSGGIIERGNVIVRDGRIVCVGTCDNVTRDRDIDLTGKTIVPGFMDVHEHSTEAWPGVVPQHRPLSALTLAYGVTTIRDPAISEDEWSFMLSELIEAGDVVGPRTFSVGALMKGYGEHEEMCTFADALRAVRIRAHWGAVAVKNYLQNDRGEQQKTIEAARYFGLSVTSEGGNMQYSQLTQIMDGATGFEHYLPYLPIHSDLARFLGQAGVVYSPTAMVAGHPNGSEEYFSPRYDFSADRKYSRFAPKLLPTPSLISPPPMANFSFPIIAEGLRDVISYGGYGALGEHGVLPGLGTQWEMWSYAEALPPLQALEIASVHASHFLGLDRELGKIETHMIADIVVLDADPLADIHNTARIAFVMKAGMLYDGNTLAKIWPRDDDRSGGSEGSH
jgi:Tol biopolymer transport system component